MTMHIPSDGYNMDVNLAFSVLLAERRVVVDRHPMSRACSHNGNFNANTEAGIRERWQDFAANRLAKVSIPELEIYKIDDSKLLLLIG